MEKMDRRKLRSRALITDALLSLLMEKSFHEITIQEIVDYANVGRATFYLHYGSKDECLLQLLTQGFDSLVIEIDKISDVKGMVSRIESIFEHTTKNRKLYLALLENQYSTISLVNVQDYITEKILEKGPFEKDVDPLIKKAKATFLAGALQNMQVWWLKEQPQISTREAAEMFIQFAAQGCLTPFSPQL